MSKILLIDDDRQLVESLTMFLESEMFITEAVLTSENAKDSLRHYSYD